MPAGVHDAWSVKAVKYMFYMSLQMQCHISQFSNKLMWIIITYILYENIMVLFYFWGKGKGLCSFTYYHYTYNNIISNLYTNLFFSILALPRGWFWPSFWRRLWGVLHDSWGSQGLLPCVLQEIHPGNGLGQIHGPAVRDVCRTEGVVQQRLMPRES